MDEDEEDDEGEEIDRLLAEFGLELPDAEDDAGEDRLLDWGWE